MLLVSHHILGKTSHTMQKVKALKRTQDEWRFQQLVLHKL
jgi:hypothetical protein